MQRLVFPALSISIFAAIKIFENTLVDQVRDSRESVHAGGFFLIYCDRDHVLVPCVPTHMCRMLSRSRTWFGALLLACLLTLLPAASVFAETYRIADLEEQQLREILPGAESFQQVEGQTYWEGRNAADEIVGWIALSTDVVSIKGYSSKPLVTLIGLDTEGVISGVNT